MWEIRSWAAGALAVATLAVGLGAGAQIVRTSEAPVAPVVAVAPAAVPTTTDTPPPTTTPRAAAPPATTTTTTATSPRSSTSRPTTTRSTRTSRTTVTVPRETAEDEGPVASGPAAARAYRACVRATNSPGPGVCRALVDAGVRGE